MSFRLPGSLSPSKVSAFKDCPLAFRFSAIERLPEPPSPWTLKGTLVHRALEGLFWSLPGGQRTPHAAADHLDAAWTDLRCEQELASLGMGAEEVAALREDAAALVRRYFQIEDPNAVTAVGVEVTLEARLGSLLLRGIIDRLDIDADGGLVVTDYKTGRVPRQAQEQSRLGGVHFYAYLCEQALGVRPSKVQLLYLREPVVISAVPSEQSLLGLRTRTLALWSAVERACRDEDFRPRPSALCAWCNWQAWCPEFGGDPSRAAAEASTVPS